MELKMTDDGSHTLSLLNSSECYHSKHGAIQESNHVFINAGLKFVSNRSLNKINILEIGFGTGLNAFLSLHESQLTHPIHYTSIEPFPIEKSIWSRLNYEQQLTVKKGLFSKLHTSPWEKDVEITPLFTLLKTKKILEQSKFDRLFDLVYFDAFSPDTAPDLWKPEFFTVLKNKLHSDSVLVTYCSKGIVKQALKSAGFYVKRLPGPPGKWHMLRASL
ncbi:tRNA (5-methylaminomethyl-2-thiouridine)(34)-methyltransferase MnmD [bacterium]|nr:tRNA (5-methylaminomethyl-2-thiouridine)(34)-methyltransferase MnmD [bacterium]